MRSLWHLSRHLTARADDNHAAPPRRSRRKGLFPGHAAGVRARVRFLAHVPPLVRAPVNSFEFHRCRRTPQVGCLTLSLGHRLLRTDGGHPSFTVRTTRVSNPVRYPHLRASASVAPRQDAFADGVLRDIYAFHRYTTNSTCPVRTQAPQFQRLRAVGPRNFTADLKAAYAPFKPNKSG